MPVLAAFVDDSKQKALRKGLGTLIALGAVVFPFEELKPFADDVNARFDEDKIPHSVEMKWSEDSKRDWFRANKKTKLLTPLRKDVIALALSHGAKAVVVLWDTSLQRSLRQQPAEHHVIEWLWERVSMMIENRDSIGIVVFDKPGGDNKTEDKWISETLDLTASGNTYVKANAIVMPFLTAPSHHHRHLQVADLITGAVTAAIAGKAHGIELIPDVKPLMHRNALTYIGGTGLKLYPDRLNNLHYWVMNEDAYTRSSQMAGITIPSQDFEQFVLDDGLKN